MQLFETREVAIVRININNNIDDKVAPFCLLSLETFGLDIIFFEMVMATGTVRELQLAIRAEVGLLLSIFMKILISIDS